MKNSIRRAGAACMLAASVSWAGPQAMFGLSYTWGGSFGAGNVGLSARVLSDNEKDRVVAGAGVSYYPWAVDKFGADVSAGYLFDSFALTGGWDFIQSDFIMSAGYVNTVDDKGDDPAPASDPAPAAEESEPPASEPSPDAT